jgi:hypothetical protein
VNKQALWVVEISDGSHCDRVLDLKHETVADGLIYIHGCRHLSRKIDVIARNGPGAGRRTGRPFRSPHETHAYLLRGNERVRLSWRHFRILEELVLEAGCGREIPHWITLQADAGNRLAEAQQAAEEAKSPRERGDARLQLDEAKAHAERVRSLLPDSPPAETGVSRATREVRRRAARPPPTNTQQEDDAMSYSKTEATTEATTEDLQAQLAQLEEQRAQLEAQLHAKQGLFGHPTAVMLKDVGTDAGLMLMGVEVMGVLKEAVREFLREEIPGEYVGMLDSEWGEMMVDLLTPIAAHLAASYDVLPVGNDLVKTVAPPALKGQLVIHGVQFTSIARRFVKRNTARLMRLKGMAAQFEQMEAVTSAGGLAALLAQAPEDFGTRAMDMVREPERVRVAS